MSDWAIRQYGRSPIERLLRRLLSGLSATGRVVLLACMCLVLGLIVGAMAVILPPLASLGIVAMAGIALLWLMPDRSDTPDHLLWPLFRIAFIVNFTVPVYYAITGPGLPWISIRRVFWFAAVLMASYILATSAEYRRRMGAALAGAREVSIPAIGFLLWICVSIVTSVSRGETLAAIWNSYLYWGFAALITMMCVRTEQEVKTFLQLLCVLAMIAGLLGLVEKLLQYHYYIEFLPGWLKETIFARNPQMLEILVREAYRNGAFRANYIFNISLSYGEFLACCAPLILCFALSESSWRARTLAGFALLACVLGVFASGARGGYAGLAISLPFVFLVWLVRVLRARPESLAGPIVTTIFVGLVSAFVTLAIAWKPLRWKFTGGYEGAGSTAVRWEQWKLAVPKILANPVTGYGHGTGNSVVGYFTPGGVQTVDSYVITLLVDSGVPGLVFFFSAILLAAFSLVRAYLTDRSNSTATMIGLAGALLSFASYRIVLTQTENHFLLFTLLGLSIIYLSQARLRQKPNDEPAGQRGWPSGFS